MPYELGRVSDIVLACCVVHNLLRLLNPQEDVPVDVENPDTHNVTPRSWRDNAIYNLSDMAEVNRGNISKTGGPPREYPIKCVTSEDGSVRWQLDMI